MAVSDKQLVKNLEKLLFEPGFRLTTVDDIVKRLESQVGVSLSHKTSFIGEQASVLLASAYPVYPVNHFMLNPPSRFQDGEINGSKLLQRNHHVNPDQQMEAGADSQDAETKGSDVGESLAAKKRGSTGGFNKVCGVTPQLKVIVVKPTLPRTEIVKELWGYIRRNNLQDPSDKRKIICDDALRAVLEIDSTDMFQMNKLLSKHIIKLEPPKEEEKTNQAKKLKVGSVDGQSSTGNGELVPKNRLKH